MDEFIRLIKKNAMRMILLPLKALPVKNNRVVFFNNLANNYSCNPKYVAEYLRKKYIGKLDLVFIVKNPNEYNDKVKGIRFVKLNSFPYFFNMMTTKVFVTNSGGHSYFPLRKSQYVINTWHGGGAYKKAGLDMYKNAKGFRRDLQLSANHTNVFLSTNKRFTEVISVSMLVPKNVFWEIGMPRNDMLLNRNSVKSDKIKEKLGLKKDEKLVLYAPTYRKINDNYFKDSVAISYGIDPERVCNAFTKRFGGKWKFAIRLHPCVVNRNDYKLDNVIDLTDYDDMQELLLVADAMINDFSSSMWDYMLTKKPNFIFAVDLQHYIDTTEVYTPVNEWPFPKSTNNDELEEDIINFNEENYINNCSNHYKALGGCETGRASELISKKIAKVCKIKK